MKRSFMRRCAEEVSTGDGGSVVKFSAFQCIYSILVYRRSGRGRVEYVYSVKYKPDLHLHGAVRLDDPPAGCDSLRIIQIQDCTCGT